jgi:hypothetical protein
MLTRNLNLVELGPTYQGQEPFPSICLDGFLDPDFALRVAQSYPDYEQAAQVGRSFSARNEKRKAFIADPNQFPGAVRELSDLLASPLFIAQLETLTGIENLLWDPHFFGGGMHLTASSGWLDVHVDFNLLVDAGLHRRINLLLYLNETWQEEWGGAVELWNENVTECAHTYEPALNRCVIFSTSSRSFHGVTPVVCPAGVSRNSFAVYYYTKEAPPEWDGKFHDTRFRARPHEVDKQRWMPAVDLKRKVGETFQNARYQLGRLRR